MSFDGISGNITNNPYYRIKNHRKSELLTQDKKKEKEKKKTNEIENVEDQITNEDGDNTSTGTILDLKW